MRGIPLLSILLVTACTDRPRGEAMAATAVATATGATGATGAASASVVPASTAPADPPDAAAIASVDLDAGAPARGPCADGMVLVDRFCIDRYEAHLVAPGEGGLLAPLPHNQRPPADVRFEARSAAGVMPQGYMSRVESAAACKNAGKRLCSMREWRRACEGRRGTTFPYGAHRIPGRCNHEKPHLLSIRFGPDSRRWKYEQFNDPSLDAEPGFLARTGEYEGCASAEGVLDLVGNLHEWVSDTVDREFMDRFEAEEAERRTQPWREGNGVFMGGFFSTADQLGAGCKYTTIAHEPTYHDYSIGFRCCAAADLPPPAKAPKKTRRTPK